MKSLFLAVGIVLMSSQAFAQQPAFLSAAAARSTGAADVSASLATPTGHEVKFTVSGYNYTEPGDRSISIHGAKFGGEYTGTVSLSNRRQWFLRADARGIVGATAYDGWCAPFVITPDSASPNRYRLDLGDYSPCSDTGDRDWYVEARGLIGRDVTGEKWGVAPYAGLGLRHLSNGTTGIPGFRTDDYLYLPLGMTARTMVASRRALSFTVEYDRLIRGWQTTRNSALGSGEVPATPTAPAFTINGLTDVSFEQHKGWALRAGAKYQATLRWSLEPYYVHWNVSDSPVSDFVATFTVNNVTVREQWGAVEPRNATREVGVKLGFRFCRPSPAASRPTARSAAGN